MAGCSWIVHCCIVRFACRAIVISRALLQLKSGWWDPIASLAHHCCVLLSLHCGHGSVDFLFFKFAQELGREEVQVLQEELPG